MLNCLKKFEDEDISDFLRIIAKAFDVSVEELHALILGEWAERMASVWCRPERKAKGETNGEPAERGPAPQTRTAS